MAAAVLLWCCCCCSVRLLTCWTWWPGCGGHDPGAIEAFQWCRIPKSVRAGQLCDKVWWWITQLCRLTGLLLQCHCTILEQAAAARPRVTHERRHREGRRPAFAGAGAAGGVWHKG
jgi:hypothetical protein